MLSYIPTHRNDMGGRSWLWLDLPTGDRVMFMDAEHGVRLNECVVAKLAENVLKHPAKAS